MSEVTLTREVLEKLSVPFPADAVSFKPGALTKAKDRAMALAYVDPRYYYDRLNEVVGPDWSDAYQVQNDGQVVVCALTIGGVTRCDLGEDDSGGQDDDRGPKNKATTSAAQAFKRACVKFGLGAYLYRLPRTWAEYDPVKKTFTDEALAKLARQLGGPAQKKVASGNGDRPEGSKGDKPAETPAASKSNGNGSVGPTQFWQTVKELGADKAKAQAIANGPGTWGEKVAALRN